MGRDSERGKYTSTEGSRTWEYLTATFTAIGMFSLGTVMGWNSPTLAELMVPNSRILITPDDASTLAACLSIGHIISLPLSVCIVDRIGRRNSVLLSTLPLMISWGMIAVAESAMVLIVARVIAGLAVGVTICTCPIYMAEVLSTHIRGSLGAIGAITCYSGVFFMFVVAPYLGVRLTACCCTGFTLTFLICFWFIPESPYFLVMVGREEEAEIALVKLRGKTDVADELELIKTTLREKGKSLVKTDDSEKRVDTKSQNAFKQLFTIRGNLKAFIIGMIATTLQHFCGFHVVMVYCHVIFKAIGSGVDVYVASLVFSALQLLSAGLIVFTVDRFGRRPLLFISAVITISILAVIATYFYLMEHTDVDVKPYSMVPLYSIFILVMGLNVGLMSVPPTLQAEIYAPDVKMLANCIVGLSGASMTVIISKFYLLIAVAWGFGHSIPFIGFTVITLVCTALLMWLLPETKGKTLLQIQQELNA